MVKLLRKINDSLLETINLGEEYFYKKFASNLENYLKAACFIIRADKHGQYKIYPEKHKVQLSLLEPFNATKLLKGHAVKSLVRLDKLMLNKIQEDPSLANEELEKKLIVRTVKSIVNKREIKAVLILQKHSDADFSNEELLMVDYFRDLLVMADGLFDYEKKVTTLTQKNSSLSQMLTINFPNIDKFPVQEQNMIETSYLVMDIRKSTDLNTYLKEHGGNNKLTMFYEKFRSVCDNIAVTQFGAWFRKQIGDQLNFAWQGKDQYENAIKAAIEIMNGMETVRREVAIPFSIPIGIAIARGSIKADYYIGELKGDAPRLAFEIQESHKGIFLANEPGSGIARSLKTNGYLVFEKSLIVRNKLLKVWEVRKAKLLEYDIEREDTYEQLRFANRIYADGHLHIEGVNTYTFNFLEKFNKSVLVFNRDPELKSHLEGLTNQRLSKIINSYLNSLYTNKEEKFSFPEFLTKLFCTKIVLASRPNYARTFIRETLNEYFNKFVSVRLGITPSIPVDFPHLDRKQWNDAVYDGLTDALSDNPTRNMTLVIETKRQHLTMKANGQYIYENNLQFLKDLYNRKHVNMNFSLSVCDDASLYPLFNADRRVQFEKFLNTLKTYPDVLLSIHMLETLPNQDAVDVSKLVRIVDNPVLELEYVLGVLNRKKINGVTFIHMSNLFAGANPDVEYRTPVDDARIVKGRELLNIIAERHDRMVVCFSSNMCLCNPFLLDYPEVIELLLTGKLNISLGTDDPGAFRVRDIDSELNKVVNRIKSNYKYGLRIGGEYYTGREIAVLSKFILARNSWRQWNSEKNQWIDQDIVEVGKRYGYDYGIFTKMMHYDICPDFSSITQKDVRKEICNREKELIINF